MMTDKDQTRTDYQTGRDTQRNIQVVTFQMEDQSYGINIFYLDEIIPFLKIAPIPRGPAFLEGVINLRGDIIPVIDLRKQFGFTREVFTIDSRILIINFESKRIGFVVDGVKDIKEFTREQIHPSVVKSDQAGFIEGIAKLQTGQIIQLITLNKILDEECLNQLSILKLDSRTTANYA